MLTGQEADLRDLAALCDGDREALGALYDRHASVLLALGERILGNRREAEDLLHDVFVEIWQHAGDYDPERGKVSTWIRLRMRSRALDRVRAASRRERIGDVTDRLLSEVGPHQLVDAHGSFDGASFDGLLGDNGALREAITELPEEQSAVIVLSYFAGMSASEIAEAVGVPVGTVKSRAAAAMQKLRQALLPDERVGASSRGVP